MSSAEFESEIEDTSNDAESDHSGRLSGRQPCQGMMTFPSLVPGDGRDCASRSTHIRKELILLSDSFLSPRGGDVAEWGEQDDVGEQLWGKFQMSTKKGGRGNRKKSKPSKSTTSAQQDDCDRSSPDLPAHQ